MMYDDEDDIGLIGPTNLELIKAVLLSAFVLTTLSIGVLVDIWVRMA